MERASLSGDCESRGGRRARRKMLGPALERLRAGGVALDVAETQGAGDATRIAREAYGRGQRTIYCCGWGWDFV